MRVGKDSSQIMFNLGKMMIVGTGGAEAAVEEENPQLHICFNFGKSINSRTCNLGNGGSSFISVLLNPSLETISTKPSHLLTIIFSSLESPLTTDNEKRNFKPLQSSTSTFFKRPKEPAGNCRSCKYSCFK